MSLYDGHSFLMLQHTEKALPIISSKYGKTESAKQCISRPLKIHITNKNLKEIKKKSYSVDVISNSSTLK